MSSLNTSVNDNHFPSPSHNNDCVDIDDDDDLLMDDSIDLTYSGDDDYSVEMSSNEDSDVSLPAENVKGLTLSPETKNSCDNSNSLSGTLSSRKFSVESLEELHEKSTEEVIETVSDLLSWLTSNVISNMEDLCVNILDANDVYYVSCALWICQKLSCHSQVSALLTEDIYSLYLSWSFNLPVTSTTKLAIDRVLCSMYALKPEMYVTLLETMNIIHPEGHSSDLKPPHQFKHIAVSGLQAPYRADRLSCGLYQSITSFKYITLANISQSSTAARQLIQSGFLSLLVDYIIDFCISYDPFSVKAASYQSTLFQNMTSVLNFFADLCWDGQIRTWFASDGIILFWNRIFELLATVSENDTSEAFSDLRCTTIRFFCKCCWGYPDNLTKLARTLVTVFPRCIMQDSSRKSTSISRFGRQIIVKLIMAIERVYVLIETNLLDNFRSFSSLKNDIPSLPPPAYPSTKKQRLIYVDTNSNCVDVIAEVMGKYSEITMKAKHQLSGLSNVPSSSSSKKFKSEGNPKLFLWDHSQSRYISVDQAMNISQMLSILYIRGNNLEMPLIKLLLTEEENTDAICKTEWRTPFSLLKNLVDINGFEEIIHHSPIKRDTTRPSTWKRNVKIQPMNVLDMHSVAYTLKHSITSRSEMTLQQKRFDWSSTPFHSLVLFGQFIKLKDYQDEVSHKHSLETLWGDASLEYFDIDKLKTYFAFDLLKSSNPLATLPLHLLYLCLKRITISDQSNLRSDIITYGVTDMVLCCLTIFTHQSEKSNKDFLENPHLPLLNALRQVTTLVRNKQVASTFKTRNYWPKGIGYGNYYNAATNSESVETKQRLVEEEEFIAVLFYVLAAYINSDFRLYELYPEYVDVICNAELEVSTKLPSVFLDQVERSCLLPVLADYLRNDSILDICQHVLLYKALMQLLRCLASSEQMIKYLVLKDHSSAESSTSSDNSVVSLNYLLQRMKNQADTYSCSLVKTSVAGPSTSMANDDSNDEDENLISDIEITAIIVNILSERYEQMVNALADVQAEFETPTRKISLTTAAAMPMVSNEMIYLRAMKKLSFESYDIIPERGRNLVTYSFHNLLRKEQVNHPSRMRRLALESSSLSTSLPLTYSSAVFVRCDTNRLDVMKALIIGPANTPYMNGCFEFDIYFPAAYPREPMDIKLVTTGRGRVRFNPNLYQNGKVCLSLLNTWSGTPEEMWNPQTSTLVQVLISIQALIFVPDPYFNEPGYQHSRGTKAGTCASNMYNAELFPSTVKWAMIDQIENPSPCFEKVIKTHFWLKKDDILQQVTDWMNQEKENSALNNAFQRLSYELNQLEPPTVET